MPTESQFKIANAFHQGLLKISGGRLGSNFGKMPVLELTTTGRKSGKPHTVVLTSPVREGDTIVVVASKGGAPKSPAWYFNVRDNPEVEVTMRGKKQKMRAHVATAEERDRLWPKVTSTFKGYGDYQTKTDREIPLVLLDPAT